MILDALVSSRATSDADRTDSAAEPAGKSKTFAEVLQISVSEGGARADTAPGSGSGPREGHGDPEAERTLDQGGLVASDGTEAEGFASDFVRIPRPATGAPLIAHQADDHLGRGGSAPALTEDRGESALAPVCEPQRVAVAPGTRQTSEVITSDVHSALPAGASEHIHSEAGAAATLDSQEPEAPAASDRRSSSPRPGERPEVTTSVDRASAASPGATELVSTVAATDGSRASAEAYAQPSPTSAAVAVSARSGAIDSAGTSRAAASQRGDIHAQAGSATGEVPTVRVLAAGGGAMARVELDAGALGTLTLRVRALPSAAGVSVVLESGSPEHLAAVVAEAPRILRSLAEAGIDVASFEVEESAGDDSEAPSENRREADAEGEELETVLERRPRERGASHTSPPAVVQELPASPARWGSRWRHLDRVA